MAKESKTTVAVKEEAAAKTTAPVKTEEAKAEAAPKKETTRRGTVKREAVKKTTKTVRAKKESVAAAAPRKVRARKSETKSAISIQFQGRSYSFDDLVKIAKDIWKYDLQQKEEDIANIELYVNLEEKLVYYVINNEFNGNFGI